jgi:hypothetical protein
LNIRDLLSAQADVARSLTVQANEQLHERRLAAPVSSDDEHELARIQPEVDGTQHKIACPPAPSSA